MGDDSVLPTVNPTPWVAGAVVLLSLAFLPQFLRRRRAR